MIRRSHLSRIEDKKTRKRILLSVVGLIIIGLLLMFYGLPLFTRFSLLLTSGSKDTNDNTTKTTNLLILPPRLDPVVDATNSATIVVGGYASKGDTVKLIVNNTDDYKVLVGNDGKFNIYDVNLNEGDNTLVAKVIKDNKESSPSETQTIVYKKKPPTLDISSPEDGKTFFGENKNVNVNGKTDPDNKVTINDRIVFVNSDGSFSYQYPLSDGDNNLKIVAIDAADNQTTVERKVVYKP